MFYCETVNTLFNAVNTPIAASATGGAGVINVPATPAYRYTTLNC